MYCRAHAEPSMIDVNSRRCAHPGGCDKQPAYNVPGERRGLFCRDHADATTMTNVVSRRCAHPGCDKHPSFNVSGETRGLYCADHADKLKKMVDVRKPRCAHTGCVKKPVFNVPGETRGLYCRGHADDSMVDVLSRRCAHPGGCDKQPAYNLPGEKSVLYCRAHAPEASVDVVNRRCKECDDRTVRNAKYDGYCLRCFVYLFPEQKVSRGYKVKEAHVSEFVAQVFHDRPIEITYDRTLAGGCSARRPDTFLECYTHGVFEETDETQHDTEKYCSCENKRMMQLFEDAGSRPIVFVRFNPDAYTDSHGVRHPSCFKYHKRLGVPVIRDQAVWEARLAVLKERLLYHVATIPEREVTVEHLFYDGFHAL